MITVQGASAGGFPRVVRGAGGVTDLQSVPGPDRRPPLALLPWRGHQGPRPRVAEATPDGVENLSGHLLSQLACETITHDN